MIRSNMTWTKCLLHQACTSPKWINPPSPFQHIILFTGYKFKMNWCCAWVSRILAVVSAQHCKADLSNNSPWHPWIPLLFMAYNNKRELVTDLACFDKKRLSLFQTSKWQIAKAHLVCQGKAWFKPRTLRYQAENIGHYVRSDNNHSLFKFK